MFRNANFVSKSQILAKSARFILFTSFIFPHIQETDLNFNVDGCWHEHMENTLGVTLVEAQHKNLFDDLVDEKRFSENLLKRMKEGLKVMEVLNFVLNFKTKADETQAIIMNVECSCRKGLNNGIDGYTFKGNQVNVTEGIKRITSLIF